MFIADSIDTLITELPDLSNVSSTQSRNLGIPNWLKQIEEDISAALAKGVDIRSLVEARAEAIDSLLIELFKLHELQQTELALFAVGGYGRGELSPYSDVDILLLSPETLSDEANKKVDAFVARLWDIGIEPGLAVRSIQDCLQVATDITVATNLLEARLLVGNESLKQCS